MPDQSKLPDHYIQQIDTLFKALKEAEELLSVGRSYGHCVGISPALAAQFKMRFGTDAINILRNTWRVDPQKSPHGS